MSIGRTNFIDGVDVATVALTTTTDTQVIAAPSSGSLYITKIIVSNGSETMTKVAIRQDTTTKWTLYGSVNGGGAEINFGPFPWKLAAGAALKAQLQTSFTPAVNDVQVIAFYTTGP